MPEVTTRRLAVRYFTVVAVVTLLSVAGALAVHFTQKTEGVATLVFMAIPLIVLLASQFVVRPALRVNRAAMRQLALAKHQAEDETNYFQLLAAIADFANEATSVEATITFCLERICVYTGWPVGHAYLWAPGSADQLVSSGCWHLDDPARFAPFRDLISRTPLARGIGLPGQVVSSGEAVWITDVPMDADFTRAWPGIDIGVRSAFAFPVCIGPDVAAVLEFFTDRPSPPDPQLLSATKHVGPQIARVMERARARQLIEGSEQQLREAQSISQVGSWSWNIVTNAVTWSEEEHRLLGTTVGAVEPSYEVFMARVHPDDRAAAERSIAVALESGQPFDRRERMIADDGSERVIRARGRVTFGANGTPIEMSGTSQDITDQAAAEALALTASERFALVSRATQDTVWDWDLSNNDLWWNGSFYQVFGYSKGAVPLTLSFRLGLIHADDLSRVEHSLEQFLASADTRWAEEYRFLRADRTYTWVLDRGYVLRDAAGTPRRMLGAMMDVTTHKEMERMKADLVAFVSHQLRTPLSGMSWMLELAADVPGLPDDARGYVSGAQESAHHLVNIVNDLLDVSRHEYGQISITLETVQLQPLTESVLDDVRLLVAAKSLGLTVDLPPDVAPVMADPQLLRQVILNLISNAIKYTPEGGTIAIALARQGDVVRWSITDTGVGIAQAAQGRLFEKFYRVDNLLSESVEGTGLGLYLARLILRRLDGEVACQSEEGQGATFSFDMPVATIAVA